MRYDTPIFFQSVTEKGAYNANTGDYSPDTVAEVKKYADITSSGIEALKLIYGNLKQGSFIIRLQRPYKKPFDKIRIENKTYNVDFSRWEKVFIVSEVQ